MSTPSLFEEFAETPSPKTKPVIDKAARLREKMLEVHARLCAEYECPIAYFHTLDPMDELISSLLSHRTKNADSSRAWKQLRAKFSDWQDALDAPVSKIEEAIAPATWPEQKAPRVQAVLREVKAKTGGFSLDFLGEMSVVDARAWLESLPGVGPKTSAATLSFSSLRMRALPVDSHHHRLAQRLALIPASLSVGPSHAVLEAMLPAEWDAQQVYDNHEILMLHGQRVCHHHSPKCEKCVLLDLCPTGQKLRANIAE